MTKKWIYSFAEYDKAEAYARRREDVKGLLGGKGAALADMVRIGLPVPCGFIISTEGCKAYFETGGAFPEGLWEQVLDAMQTVESTTGKTFGGADHPLLVSCRSGAKFSMPGMMDTVLNIGLNDQTAEAMINHTGDPRFVFDSYRRLIQMFGSVVMGIPDDIFEKKIKEAKKRAGVKEDSELNGENWRDVKETFKSIYRKATSLNFPQDPYEQLRMAVEAVFKSWNGKRAIDYRNAANIPHDLGTAVNIVMMVFGNLGTDSATGVAMTRNGSTGDKKIEGDYLVNAQGEDVVAGTRTTNDISLMKKEMPAAYKEIKEISQKLENHYRDMQDIEFTIERGKLWMLQTRDGKRTATAAVRIAVDLVDEGIITKEEAVMRVSPDQIDFFLHPQFDRSSIERAENEGDFLEEGLNVSPGAASGIVALDADVAEAWKKEDGKDVIMVRPETKPDDVHGMLASNGILTSRGGRTSHAALVARQFGKPAVVGMSDLKIDMAKRLITIHNRVVHEGEEISIDGTTGRVYAGKIDTVIPDIKDPWLIKLLSWADEIRTLGVWTNADYPEDAKRALEYGAEGIGLCRSEHMFFEPERLPHVLKIIMTDLPVERKEALDAVLPFQRDDFEGLFRVMNGLPVIIRLLDPPLHEFLPNHADILREMTDLKIRMKHAGTLEEIELLLDAHKKKELVLKRVENMKEENPMLGLRGVRLGILFPGLVIMQVRAIFEAACIVANDGIPVNPKVMIPLTSHANELKRQREVLETEAIKIMNEQGVNITYKFGTMLELPRAALTSHQIVEHADFISFGTNDLTQTTYGISRDDAEAGFLIEYMENGIFPDNPFATIDREGVGRLMEIAVEKGKNVNPAIECGICGEHGGDPNSIAFCHELGLDYVSCSPYRVPVARLAAAHAELKRSGK